MSLSARVDAALDRLLAAPLQARLGLAVSGGGDSIALLHLAARWAAARAGCRLHVVTVDHGLRSEAAAEARDVARTAAALGLSHDTLRWKGWDGRGNLQDAARRARQALIADWAAERGIGAVLTGHTLDDQAETVLMRLARGSGVDGLAGMAPTRDDAGVRWVRPLLAERRARLRDYLRDAGLGWAEDQSNDDTRFDRVRARQLLDGLAGLGLSPERLAATADHMRAARDVLDAAAAALARAAVSQCAGALIIDRARFGAALPDTRHRLLAAALGWVSGARYRPRHGPLTALAEGLCGTLHGAQLVDMGAQALVVRELSAVAGQAVPAGQVWDGRWQVTGPARDGDMIGALGEAGLAEIPGWRATGLPRAALLVSPAVRRRDGTLIAAPLAEHSKDWHTRLVPPRDDFVAAPIMR